MAIPTKPGRFTKKPVEIEAFQFRGWTNAPLITTWSKGDAVFVPTGYEHRLRRENELDRGNGHVDERAPSFMVIATLEGDMRADVNDWIVRGVNGEHYPVKPDIFAKTYDEAGA